MRVLYITPYVPSRIRVRPYNLIKRLSKRHEVTLVALVQSDHDRHALGEMEAVCADVKPVRMTKVQSMASCGKRLFTRMPLQAAYTYLPNLVRTVDDLIVKQRFDVVHVEHVRGAHYAAHIGSLPKVYDSVDCITLLLSQFLKTKRNPAAWFLALEEWAKMRVYEAMITQKFEKVVITSRHDQMALESLIWDRLRKRIGFAQIPARPPETSKEIEDWRITRQLVELAQDQRLSALQAGGTRVSVLPNGVDHEYFAPMDVPEDPNTIVFSGKMSYYANTAAILNFHENVMPIVKQRRPNTKLVIVGADPTPAVRALQTDPAVTVTGYVEDIRPYIARAAVAVCPVTVGVGIQNKVLEAMSMGKAVVATKKACSAISAVPGRDCLTADDPADFATQVTDLLASEERRRETGQNAAHCVREHHDWETIAEDLANVYDEAGRIFRNTNPHQKREESTNG